MPDLPAAAWHDVSVRYPYEKRDAVGPVSFALKRGERLLLLGPSGSGKSTLLNTMTGLIPHTVPADRTGDVRLGGEPVGARPPAGWAVDVARFFQNAEETLCGMRVEDEIAFALENRALPELEIRNRVTAALRLVDLPEDWRQRRSSTLSGGEKQLVALAACLAQAASIFVADEPTAHLAPAVAARLHRLLMEGDRDRSVFLVDHRLDGLVASVDRVVVLGPEGTIIAEGRPASVFRAHGRKLEELGIWLPLAARLDGDLMKAGFAAAQPPLTLTEALGGLDPLAGEDEEKAKAVVRDFAERHMRGPTKRSDQVVARLINADCAPLFGPTVLRNISLAVHEGEILGILGANGAGKSTLGASLAGLLKLKAGRREGKAGGIAFQNPENQFIAGSVNEEIALALPAGIRNSEEILRSFGLWELRDRHPFELSQGQKRRLAFAALTAHGEWPLLVLDEPTAGLDARGAGMVTRHVEALAQRGHAIAVITHDMDLALRLCARSVIVAGGRILADGPTIDLLGDADLLERAGLAEPAISPVLRWLASC
ncbi:ABC transporter ATP-binding protein [Taklimakanibacter lacteus]|uniref:ABC transporter ATP-binding protein n=1 Tax=Taklimakanibacter lacteus TaxID=2268456 RepID=UPI0013C437B8